MSRFDKICKGYVQQLDERATDKARLSDKINPGEAKVARGTANRFGKYQNSDVEPFFHDLIKDLLSREDKVITYQDASVAIKNMLTKSKDRGGMGMSPTFADKWTQHLSNSLFTLLTSVNSAVKDPEGSPEEAEAAASAEEPIDTSTDSISKESEVEKEEESAPESEEIPETEEEKIPVSKQNDADLEATAGLNLTSNEEALLDVIKGLGGVEVTNKQILADPATPFEIRDEPSKLRPILGKMAREHGLIKHMGNGWSVVEKESNGMGSALEGEDEDVYQAGVDNAYASARREMNSGRSETYRDPFGESVDILKTYTDIFKSKSRE